MEGLSGEGVGVYFLEGCPLIPYIDRGDTEQRWVEIFPGIWILWFREKYTDEEIFFDDSFEYSQAHQLRIMEERSRSTCSGRVCQLLFCPRITEKTMVDGGIWSEPRIVEDWEMRAIFTAYCLSIGAADRMRIIGRAHCLWNHMTDKSVMSDIGFVHLIGQVHRTERFLAKKLDDALNLETWDWGVINTWDAGMMLFADDLGRRYALMLWYYSRLIDTDDASQRLQYFLAAIESLQPDQKEEIAKSLIRRVSVLVTRAGAAREGLEGSYEEDLESHKVVIKKLVHLASAVKHNIWKDSYYDILAEVHSDSPEVIRAINLTLLEQGKILSPVEIDRQEKSGISPVPEEEYERRFDRELFDDEIYRYDLLFFPHNTEKFEELGGRTKMSYQEFCEQYTPVSNSTIEWVEEVLEGNIQEPEEFQLGVKEGTEVDVEMVEGVDYYAMTVAQLKDLLRYAGLPVSGKKAELIARLEEAVSREPEYIMLLGVPTVVNNGKPVSRLEVFPGLRIRWIDLDYEEGEKRLRCGDDLDYHCLRLMEIVSRETCSGMVCELEIDSDETLQFLEEVGLSHLSAKVSNFTLYTIFRSFITLVTPFRGTRMMNSFSRNWSSLLDDAYWEELDVVPKMGQWSTVLEGGDSWPGREFETIQLEQFNNWKTLIWKSAMMLIEDQGVGKYGGRLFKSLDDSTLSFLCARDVYEKNLGFIQTLVTLLRPNNSKGMSLEKIVPVVYRRYEKDDDNLPEEIEQKISESRRYRRDFLHGRIDHPEWQDLVDLTYKYQHEILARVYSTVIIRGGIPDIELISEAMKNGDSLSQDLTNLNMGKWEEVISQEVIDAEDYRYDLAYQ